jgi:hypothetical protein
MDFCLNEDTVDTGQIDGSLFRVSAGALLHRSGGQKMLPTSSRTRHPFGRDVRTIMEAVTTQSYAMTISLRCFLASIVLGILGLTSAKAGSTEAGAGNYGGLLRPSPGGIATNSGLVQLQLTKTGQMSGVLIWQGQRYPFRGPLTEEKPFSLVFKKKFSSIPTDLRMFLQLTLISRVVSGVLSEEQNGSTTLSLSIFLNGAPADPTLVENLRPGLRISFIDPPDPTTEGETTALAGPVLGPGVPEITGDGFVHVRVSKSKKRSTRLVGRLPDAEGAFTAGSPLRGASYAIFGSLYKKRRVQGGQVFGDVGVFNTANGVDVLSTMRWGKNPNPNTNYYPGGIDYIFSLDALTYPKVKRGALPPLLPESPSPSPLAPLAAAPYGVGPEPTRSIDARVLFRRGNISVPDGLGGFDRFFKQNIKMTPFHTRLVGPNPFHVKIQVDAFSGRFHGTFIHPVLNAKTKFRGAFQAAVLFTPGQGRGHFRPPSGPGITPLLDPLESGGVRINVQ